MLGTRTIPHRRHRHLHRFRGHRSLRSGHRATAYQGATGTRGSSHAESHPRYAPPPHVAAHWDNRPGVYVVEGRELYYRERLYYRWDGDWFCAARPDGPWEPVAPPSVPPGLRERY